MNTLLPRNSSRYYNVKTSDIVDAGNVLNVIADLTQTLSIPEKVIASKPSGASEGWSKY